MHVQRNNVYPLQNFEVHVLNMPCQNFYTLKSKYVENKKNIAHYSSFTILTEKINLSK